ncbi:hypothetical protein [Streptomyces sp. SBT349]|uniref:hypothetical protein n=1 Tax=Streptomyces sp. SBT349 TaxID=1580539 RepID=UPI00066A5976|nr:hypothetical protein [Streptomyces sp. SBT349]
MKDLALIRRGLVTAVTVAVAFTPAWAGTALAQETADTAPKQPTLDEATLKPVLKAELGRCRSIEHVEDDALLYNNTNWHAQFYQSADCVGQVGELGPGEAGRYPTASSVSFIQIGGAEQPTTSLR